MADERSQRLEDPVAERRLRGAPFSGKLSNPWTPDLLHDFMHAKIVVADDVVFVGSFNFSRSGERNAENVLEIHDPALADRLATFVDAVRARYPRTTPPQIEGRAGALPCRDRIHEDDRRSNARRRCGCDGRLGERRSPRREGVRCSLPTTRGTAGSTCLRWRRVAATIAAIGATKTMHADFGSGLWDGGPIGIPITVVGKSQPKSVVRFEYADESDRGPYPIPAGVRIEGGAAADGDRHALIVDRDACRLYELFALRRVDGRWDGRLGSIWNLRSNRLRPAGWTSSGRSRVADPAGPRPLRRGLTAAGSTMRSGSPSPRRVVGTSRRHATSPSSLTDSALPPMGAPAAAEARLRHLGLPAAVAGRAQGFAGVRDDRGRQRLRLVRLRRARSTLVERRPAHPRAGCRVGLRGRRRLLRSSLTTDPEVTARAGSAASDR